MVLDACGSSHKSLCGLKGVAETVLKAYHEMETRRTETCHVNCVFTLDRFLAFSGLWHPAKAQTGHDSSFWVTFITINHSPTNTELELNNPSG